MAKLAALAALLAVLLLVSLTAVTTTVQVDEAEENTCYGSRKSCHEQLKMADDIRDCKDLLREHVCHNKHFPISLLWTLSYIYKCMQFETYTNLFLRTMSHLSSSKRLPLHLRPLPTSSSSPPPYISPDNHDQSNNYGSGDNTTTTLDLNIVKVFSVLLCALICSLGLNSLIRCALRCSTRLSSDPEGSSSRPSARLTNTGVKKKALKTFPIVSYSPDLDLPGIDAECVICLSVFSPGDRVRLLLSCLHWFHARCIDKWLSLHSSRPTRRQCLLETCQKITRGHGNDKPRWFGIRTTGDDSNNGRANLRYASPYANITRWVDPVS